MHISEVKVNGFRNYQNATIKFNNKTLIIGSNDIGKTNLLYAIRLLLDKKIPESDLEPKDSDFHVYSDNIDYEIQIKFTWAIEDCIVSRLGKYISDNSEFYIKLYGYKDETTKVKGYKLYIGHSEDDMEEIESRFYLKAVHMEFISSNRDLMAYVKKERKNLLVESKKIRNETIVNEDEKITKKIERTIEILNKRMTNLSYIKDATKNINSELENLSLVNSKGELFFDIGAYDVDNFIAELELVSKINEKSLSVGGEGRNNQIYLALWTSKNKLLPEPLEIKICCIEEPEAHLHPHQQRKLADYLVENLNTQVILTSHSPQIACEFPYNSIVRLYNDLQDTKAANNGCSQDIKDAFLNFGHRMNVIPAEAFFSNLVFLVEGTSEVLFYKSLCNVLGLNLDKYNLSILSVEGVGFKSYIDVLNVLNIPWIMRTDNDIFKVPRKPYYYYSGISRGMKIALTYLILEDNERALFKDETYLRNIEDRDAISKEHQEYADVRIKALSERNIFLSNVDLENDLLNSSIKEDIIAFLGDCDYDEALLEMQDAKATFMFQFLADNQNILTKLKDDNLLLPIKRCLEILGVSI